MAKKRVPRKHKNTNRLYWLLIPLIGIMVVGGSLAVIFTNHKQNPAQTDIHTEGYKPVDGISCSSSEGSAVHYHVHLSIYVDGKETIVPANIGVNDKCLYWIHTHDTTGIIHIESPVKNKTFTLKDFYDIYGHNVNSNTLNSKAYINGELYKGNLNDIVLEPHEQIVIEYGSQFLKQIPVFQFPSGT